MVNDWHCLLKFELAMNVVCPLIKWWDSLKVNYNVYKKLNFFIS